MSEQHFRLNSRDEVEQFQRRTDEYLTLRGQFSPSHLSLVDAYDYCQSRQDGGKVFAALLDIHINFTLLWCDTIAVASAWGANPDRTFVGGSVLESSPHFIWKMDVHRYNSSFVLRYRALWDKIMGVLILIYLPHEYEKFVSSSSRKKTFLKLSQQYQMLEDTAAQSLREILEMFDNEFRTPEAHGTGALRKWSFTLEPINQDPSMKLIGYWNVINGVIMRLGKFFSGSPPAPATTTTSTEEVP